MPAETTVPLRPPVTAVDDDIREGLLHWPRLGSAPVSEYSYQGLFAQAYPSLSTPMGLDIGLAVNRVGKSHWRQTSNTCFDILYSTSIDEDRLGEM